MSEIAINTVYYIHIGPGYKSEEDTEIDCWKRCAWDEKCIWASHFLNTNVNKEICILYDKDAVPSMLQPPENRYKSQRREGCSWYSNL